LTFGTGQVTVMTYAGIRNNFLLNPFWAPHGAFSMPPPFDIKIILIIVQTVEHYSVSFN